MTTTTPPSMEKNTLPGANGKASSTQPTGEEMNDEDRQLMETLDMLISRLQDTDHTLHRPALEALRTQIRSSAVSLTSVPRALKFLRARFPQLVTIHNWMSSLSTTPAAASGEDNCQKLADILAVIAMCGVENDQKQLDSIGNENTTENLTIGNNVIIAKRPTLFYHLKGTNAALGEWGHEYVRHLAMELVEEYENTTDEGEGRQRLLKLAKDIAIFFLDHNGEPDACDLLYELDQLQWLVDLVAINNGNDNTTSRDYERVALYLLSCVPFEAEGDDRTALLTIYQLYRRVKDWPHALLLALRLGDGGLIRDTFSACVAAVDDEEKKTMTGQIINQGKLMRQQSAYILARHGRFHVNDLLQRADLVSEEEKTILQTILDNGHLSRHFRALARELDVMTPRTPDEIYKSHLQDSLRVPPMPSPKQNLAAALVNGLVNAGFGSDTLLTSPEVQADSHCSWIYRVKGEGVVATVASLGLLHLWDGEGALNQLLDEHLGSDQPLIRAGAALGLGLAQVGIRTEADPVLALLREHIESNMGDGNDLIKECALMGLALAYSGTARKDVGLLALPLVSGSNGATQSGSSSGVGVSAMAALTLGHLFVGTGDGDVASLILQSLLEKQPQELDQPIYRFHILALALLYLGRSSGSGNADTNGSTTDEAAVVIETLRVIRHPLAREAEILLKMCYYAGSGNVLKIQELLRICTTNKAEQSTSTSKTDDKAQNDDNSTAQDKDTPAAQPEETEKTDGGDGEIGDAAAFAVLGVAMIGMMDEISREMSHRLFSHLMHYGSGAVRKAVPLAIGLLYASHPAPVILDLLSKWSHDADRPVALSAIFALGLVGGGTNNAKVAQMLRQLAAYYQRDPDCLFLVRVAQGLTHAAKGTISFSPVHSHRLLLNPSALAGLLTILTVILNASTLFLDRAPYLLYFVILAMYPRCLITLTGDDDVEKSMVGVSVRVGQAVDVVGQAGRPKTITGFQTHTTPVLLAHGERAEMATEEFLPLSPILENFVIVYRNPHWVADQ